MEPNERIVLVCAEAPGLSWPSFRKNVPDANAKIGKLVDEWRKQFGDDKTAKSRSPATAAAAASCSASSNRPTRFRLTSIASRFSTRTTRSTRRLHAKKLEDWLNGNNGPAIHSSSATTIAKSRSTVRKSLGPTAARTAPLAACTMRSAKMFKLTDSVHDPFQETTGLDGRIHFYIHPNPENKILHTVLVGEMNGLLQIATLGTPQEGKWGKFGGPRAYTKYVQAEPTHNVRRRDDARQQIHTAGKRSPKKLRRRRNRNFPPRPPERDRRRRVCKTSCRESIAKHIKESRSSDPARNHERQLSRVPAELQNG